MVPELNKLDQERVDYFEDEKYLCYTHYSRYGRFRVREA